jgi:hypothetical protein
MTRDEKTYTVFGFIIGVIVHIVISLFFLGPWNSSMDGKILTDAEGTVYRVTKLGIMKDSKVMFERRERILVNDSTYEEKWHVVQDD